jgi:hypothetical protein
MPAKAGIQEYPFPTACSSPELMVESFLLVTGIWILGQVLGFELKFKPRDLTLFVLERR